MTDTASIETAEESLSYSRLLGSSIGPLSFPRPSNSLISKTYKQASNLFLWRRLPEALSTLEPIVTAPVSSDQAVDEDETPKRAPVASASRSSRIKVWSLYLTLLNAIIELGPGDGREALGGKDWKNLVVKAQDGSIWEEVVQIGYGGIEGNLDAEVVINLATLLLSQASSQTTNQQRLESYLSASNQPNLDLTGHFNFSNHTNNHRNGHVSHDHGTNTPRELASRIKIIELFALHVLPRNEEWTYARECINLSEFLDEERRDQFLQTLQALKDEKSRDAESDVHETLEREKELQYQREQEEQRILDDSQRAATTQKPQKPSSNHRRTHSEKDYGIDSSHPTSTPPPASKPPPKPINQPPPKSPRSSPGTTPPKKPTSTSIFKRTTAIMTAMQHLITNMAHSMSKNPISLLRFVLFLMGIVVALSRRDVKESVARVTGAGWEKVRRTVGMGVKVSYI